MGLLIFAAASAAGLIGTKMITKTVRNVNSEKTKANVEMADMKKQSEIDVKKLEMHKNLLNPEMQYSIKCVSCHAILTGHPFTNIRCEYCDTIQTINEDSIII